MPVASGLFFHRSFLKFQNFSTGTVGKIFRPKIPQQFLPHSTAPVEFFQGKKRGKNPAKPFAFPFGEGGSPKGLTEEVCRSCFAPKASGIRQPVPPSSVKNQRFLTASPEGKPFTFPPGEAFCFANELYRQELILAVMSRMLFCRSLSLFFNASSTLRMLYSTVE